MEAALDPMVARKPDLKQRIVGGGAAGITVAAELRRRKRDLDIAIVEPSGTHSYQPGWTRWSVRAYSRESRLSAKRTL